MILVNIKKDSWSLLRVFMALVFLGAAVFRIFNLGAAKLELFNLNLPQLLIWPLIILEFIGGLCLIFDYQSRKVAMILALFLFFALIQALLVDYQGILEHLPDLFVFKANTLDWFLHLVFIFVLISLFRRS